MAHNSQLEGQKFLPVWMLANGLGFGLGAAAIPLIQDPAGTLANHVLAGLIFASIFALAQWLVLRRFVLWAGIWLVATWGVHALAGTVPDAIARNIPAGNIDSALFVLIFGPGMGIAQWLVLRRHYQKTGVWIFIPTLAMMLGLASLFLSKGPVRQLLSFMDENLALALLGGFIAGVLYGAVTGFVLLRLTKNQRAAEAASMTAAA